VRRHRLHPAAPALALGLAACAPMAQQGMPVPAGGTSPAPNAAGIVTKTENNGRYVIVIGPHQQHGSPFFGIADTNYYVLRSLIDRSNGKTAHQLYVENSYIGPEHRWDTARDGWGQPLTFIPISHHELNCEGGRCAYADEFAASIPEAELRGSTRGLEVTFSGGKTHDKQVISVPGNLVALQLSAFDAARAAPPGSIPAGPAAARPGAAPAPTAAAYPAAPRPRTAPGAAYPAGAAPAAAAPGFAAAAPAAGANPQGGEQSAEWPRRHHRRHHKPATALGGPEGAASAGYDAGGADLPQPLRPEPGPQPEAPVQPN